MDETEWKNILMKFLFRTKTENNPFMKGKFKGYEIKRIFVKIKCKFAAFMCFGIKVPHNEWYLFLFTCITKLRNKKQAFLKLGLGQKLAC